MVKVFLLLKLLVFSLNEELKVFFRYYFNLRFLVQDGALKIFYLFENPYRSTSLYGETPLTTMDKIARECRILSHDVVFELGSGRGRASLWLHSFTRCEVIGIEKISSFVKKGNGLKKLFRLSKISFLQSDILDTDFSKASVIYFYGTSFEDDFILKLIDKIKSQKRAMKVITVSYPLSDYSEDFTIKKQFKGSFPWGEADVYINQKN